MDGNIEHAAWTIAQALKYLADAISSLNYFSQKATFAPAPAPQGEPMQPSYPAPTYPLPMIIPVIPPNGGTTTPMPPRPVIWNSTGPDSGSTIL